MCLTNLTLALTGPYKKVRTVRAAGYWASHLTKVRAAIWATIAFLYVYFTQAIHSKLLCLRHHFTKTFL